MSKEELIKRAEALRARLARPGSALLFTKVRRRRKPKKEQHTQEAPEQTAPEQEEPPKDS